MIRMKYRRLSFWASMPKTNGNGPSPMLLPCFSGGMHVLMDNLVLDSPTGRSTCRRRAIVPIAWRPWTRSSTTPCPARQISSRHRQAGAAAIRIRGAANTESYRQRKNFDSKTWISLFRFSQSVSRFSKAVISGGESTKGGLRRGGPLGRTLNRRTLDRPALARPCRPRSRWEDRIVDCRAELGDTASPALRGPRSRLGGPGIAAAEQPAGSAAEDIVPPGRSGGADRRSRDRTPAPLAADNWAGSSVDSSASPASAVPPAAPGPVDRLAAWRTPGSSFRKSRQWSDSCASLAANCC